MATKEQLADMKKARAGDASAQLALAKRYLRGEKGLAQSIPTALLWLDLAAQQGSQEAWMLIGNQIPFETAQHSPNVQSLLLWYERAFNAGSLPAGLVFAKLVESQAALKGDTEICAKALKILEAVAEAGIAEAQWLLARARVPAAQTAKPTQGDDANAHNLHFAGGPTEVATHGVLDWTSRAASGGVREARYILADRAWVAGETPTFLRWGLPLAREIVQQDSASVSKRSGSSSNLQQLSASDAMLLYRCAETLLDQGGEDDEARLFLEAAAQGGCASAQLLLGLWFAKMDKQADIPNKPRQANFKKSLDWLSRAGSQGLAEAWYAMSKIYMKAEYAGRSLGASQRLLERAAEMGHCAAQLECGQRAWRLRKGVSEGDVIAVYWLQKAALQGSVDAKALLEKIAPRPDFASWAREKQKQLTPKFGRANPFLAARIELAVLFGLRPVEALLLDVNTADQGHCLLVDVSATAPNSKRRLIAINTDTERQAVARIRRVFQGIDCGTGGPEGDYRKRQYDLNKLSSNTSSRATTSTNGHLE